VFKNIVFNAFIVYMFLCDFDMTSDNNISITRKYLTWAVYAGAAGTSPSTTKTLNDDYFSDEG